MFQKELERCWRKTTGWCFSNSLSSLLLSLAGMVLLEEMSQRSCLRLSRVVASRWSSYSCGVTCWQKVNAATRSGGRGHQFSTSIGLDLKSFFVMVWCVMSARACIFIWSCILLTGNWVRVFSLLHSPQCSPHSFNKGCRSLHSLQEERVKGILKMLNPNLWWLKLNYQNCNEVNIKVETLAIFFCWEA